MYKIIVVALLVSLFSVKSYSEGGDNHAIDETSSDFYFGVDVFTGDSDRKVKINDTPYKDEYGQEGYRFLVGKILKQGFRLEVYYASEVFDVQGGSLLSEFEKEIMSLGVNLIKTFDVERIFQPYFLAGFIGSRTRLADPNFDFSSNSLEASGFKLGAGMYLQIMESTEFKLGAAFQRRSWQDIVPEGRNTLITLDDEGITLYIGANVHF